MVAAKEPPSSEKQVCLSLLSPLSTILPRASRQLLVLQDSAWWAAAVLRVREQLRLLGGPRGPTTHPAPRVRRATCDVLALLLHSCRRSAPPPCACACPCPCPCLCPCPCPCPYLCLFSCWLTNRVLASSATMIVDMLVVLTNDELPGIAQQSRSASLTFLSFY